MIKNLIFDFGGVIVDIDRKRAVERFEALGVRDADSVLDIYHQKDIFLEVEDGRIDANGFCRKLSDYCGRSISFEQAQYAWLGYMTGVPQSRLDCLDELHKRYRMYVLSNTNPFIMGWARSNGFTAAGRPLDDYVDKIYASYQLKVVKPHKEIFELMIRDSGMNPEESIFVDDGVTNIEAGRALGFRVLQAVNGKEWSDDLKRMLV